MAQDNQNLSLKIKELYQEPISDTQAFEAAGRLVSLFKILSDIDQQQKRENNDNNRSKNPSDTTK